MALVLASSGEDDAAECPVCLEEGRECAMFPCRHSICHQCTLQLWEVQQQANGDGNTLTCPLCRTVHNVTQGMDVFLQEGDARGGLRPSSAGRTPINTPRTASNSTLADLSTAELKVVAHAQGLPEETMVERADVIAALREVLGLDPPDPADPDPSANSGVPLGKLSPKSLTALLRSRKIPYDDCVEKEELVRRVAQTPRGTCMQLPPKILKQMLMELGLGGEVRGITASVVRCSPPRAAARAAHRPPRHTFVGSSTRLSLSPAASAGVRRQGQPRAACDGCAGAHAGAGGGARLYAVRLLPREPSHAVAADAIGSSTAAAVFVVATHGGGRGRGVERGGAPTAAAI